MALLSPQSQGQQPKPQVKSQTKLVHTAVKPTCPDARKAIVYYRGLVWDRQRELGESLSPTYYPERRKYACKYKRWVVGNWRAIAAEYRKLINHLSDPETAIEYVFGEYAEQAKAVSWCESHYHTSATNGQYLGMFQMGSSERALYGHDDTALGQAKAAHRYFVASGRDWSPWSCKP